MVQHYNALQKLTFSKTMPFQLKTTPKRLVFNNTPGDRDFCVSDCQQQGVCIGEDS